MLFNKAQSKQLYSGAVNADHFLKIGYPDRPDILIGEKTTIHISLTNDLPHSEANIRSASLSCSCASVQKFPTSVAPSETQLLELLVHPNAFGFNSSFWLFLEGKAATEFTFQHLVQVQALSPFDGWPTEARFQLNDEVAVLRIADRYLKILNRVTAKAFSRGENLDIPLRLDDSLGIVIERDSLTGEADIVIKFGVSDDATWSGPIETTSSMCKEKL